MPEELHNNNDINSESTTGSNSNRFSDFDVEDFRISLGESTERNEDALSYYIKLLEIREKIYKGKDHLSLAINLNNIGRINKLMGNFEEALNYYMKSIEMYQRIYKGEDNPNVASGFNAIGNLFEILKRKKEAFTYYTRSVEMYKRIYKGDPLALANSLNNMASTLLQMEDFKGAIDYTEQALKLFVRMGMEEDPLTHTIMRNLDYLYEKLRESEDTKPERDE